jgi:heme/copper-type cytochrome/quinol oxidase subunit 2
MEMILIYPVFIMMSLAIAQLARQRGYSARWWFLIATVLPVISILLVFLVKKRKRTRVNIEPEWAKQHIPQDKVLFSKLDT